MGIEVASTFYNAGDGLPFRTILQELGHPRPPNPLEVDNQTTVGILNSTIKQKHSKGIDMCFHRIRYCVAQKKNPTLLAPRPKKIRQLRLKTSHLSAHKDNALQFFVHYVANSIRSLAHKTPAQHFLSQHFTSI